MRSVPRSRVSHGFVGGEVKSNARKRVGRSGVERGGAALPGSPSARRSRGRGRGRARHKRRKNDCRRKQHK